MNTRLPFEDAIEQKLADMPAPYEDASWQKMSKLLDNDDRRVAAPFFRSYKFWSMVAVLLLIGVGLIIRSGNHKKEDATQAVSKMNSRGTEGENKTVASLPPPQQTHGDNVQDQDDEIGIGEKKKPVAAVQTPGRDNQVGAQNLTPIADNKTVANHTTIAQVKQPNATNSLAAKKLHRKRVKRSNLSVALNTTVAGVPKKKITVPAENNIVDASTTVKVPATSPAEPSAIAKYSEPDKQVAEQELKEPVIVKHDKTTKKQAAPPMVAVPKTPPVKRKYFVSAGVGLQQSIPVGGQQAIKYNYTGSTNTLSDYIPSVWMHVEKRDRWFVKGEFSYASPQLVKDFAYSRQSKFDNISRELTTTTLRLKKTYYNELPFSFNYYVRRNWSVGAGAIYSWFRSAIIEREVNTKNVRTQEHSVTKQIETISHYTDSFLYKSHTYLLFQTDYQWRRFNVGVRYTKDVQPYIRYTLPDGAKSDEKNWSLELILRFRLWKSKGF